MMEWLDGVSRIESPNSDERPAGQVVDLLVIHNISLPPKEYGNGYVEQFFQNRLDSSEHSYFEEIADLKVSSHLFIKRDGKVVQFVPFGMRAWHAGKSIWEGRDRCNDYSIGIELEGCDSEPYTGYQYDALIEVVKKIQRVFPHILNERIVGHSDIAPQRKTDPGPFFDWKRFKEELTNR